MMKRRHVLHLIEFSIILLAALEAWRSLVAAQQSDQWSLPQRVPDIRNQHLPHAQVVDQNGTVHIFNHQDSDDGQAVEGSAFIVYTSWTRQGGWAAPVDILLPLEAGIIRVQDAWLDNQTGLIHLVFYSGNEMGASIYYTRAPATVAGRASAWSAPKLVGERASSPATAALVGDEKGNLVLIYGGNRDGNGMYAVNSDDGGDTWSDSLLLLLTYDDQIWPAEAQLLWGQSGILHAVWTTYNKAGHGQTGHYANLDTEQWQWSEPIELDEAYGLGTITPAVIEYEGDVFLGYYNGRENANYWRRSGDGGRTWTAPVRVSPRHVGTNGAMSFVVDSNNILHMFFGQRIDQFNHGVWHSVWLGDRWSGVEPVFSGPMSQAPGKEFDPADVKAFISRGNVILLLWNTDAMVRVPDVWYSFLVLDAPELPTVALPAPPPTATATATAAPAAPTRSPAPKFDDQADDPNLALDPGSPSAPLVFGVVPVALLIVGVVVVRRLYYQAHK